MTNSKIVFTKKVQKEQIKESYSFFICKINKNINKEIPNEFKDVPFVNLLSSIFLAYFSYLENINKFKVILEQLNLKRIKEKLELFLSSNVSFNNSFLT